MVPTPPSTSVVNGQTVIVAGQDPNRNYFGAVFGSFADAPGGFGEELREFTLSTGVEYWYNEQFAARVGYFGEAADKGGRRYATAGLGLRLQQRFGVDFSYLLPIRQGSPLASTFRVSLLLNLNGGSAFSDEEAYRGTETN